MITVLHYDLFEGLIEEAGPGQSIKRQRRALSYTDTRVLSNIGESLGALQAGQVDLFHFNFPSTSTLAAMAYTALNNHPTITHAHTTPKDIRDSFRGSNLFASMTKPWLRRFYDAQDGVIAVSEYTRGRLQELGVDTEITVISNGVNVQEFDGYEQYRDETRRDWDLEGPVVFSIGHPFERKGFDTFCRMAEALPEYDFFWAGPLYNRAVRSPEVNALIEDPPDNLLLTGWVDELKRIFAAGDIGFFPARVENEGMAVMEAAACSKPLVLRDIPAFAKFTDEQDCLKSDNFEGFKTRLQQLLNSHEQRQRFGHNARLMIEAYDIPEIGRQLRDFYEHIIETA